MRGRSGHGEALPKPGLISALRGPEDRLRACYLKLPAADLKATLFLVTTSILTAVSFRAFGPGGRRCPEWGAIVVFR